MKTIKLKGADTLITKKPGYSYLIESGTVIVYLAPIEDGETGRRSMIAEASEGQRIPAMFAADEEGREWVFILSGLGGAGLREDKTLPEGCISDFAAHINLPIEDESEFAEAVIERINLKLITEEGYIFATSEEQKSTYSKSLLMILDLFTKKKKRARIAQSGNLLYDTVAALCEREGIHIAGFEVIRDACGRRFTIEDISRVSHFICREVILEENWYKYDSGSLVVWQEDGRRPILCVSKKPGKYILIDCETNEQTPVDQKTAAVLEPKAYAIHRPFENKAIKVKDLISFGIKGARGSDICNLALFALIGAVIGLLLPYLNERLFDTYIPLGAASTIVEVCMLILVFSVGNIGFTIVKNLAIFRLSSGMEIDVQTAVLDRLFNLPNYFFGDYESADLSMRAFGISSIYKALSETVVTTLLSALFSLLYLFRMYNYSDTLTGMGVFLILVNMAITGTLGFMQIKYEKSMTTMRLKLSSVMYQMLSGIAKIRIAGVENRAMIKYLEPYVEYKRVLIMNEGLKNLAVNINLFLGNVFTAAFYYIMITKNLGITFGEFLGFTAAFGLFSAAMISLVTAFLQVNNVIPTYQNAKAILEMPPELEEDAAVPGKLNGKIEVSNLSFRYSEEGGMILSDLSFSINPGEYVGVVGSSGSGKSTLLKVLLGFERPSLGKVYYDDQDMDGIDKRELRKRFGVVLQDGQLIAGSIYDNIAITGDGIALERVKEVVADVGLEKDIQEMPMGLHTIIAEGAGTISGGQRQRILIARAIANKPKVIFFDEATSALDNINQALVCESIEKLKATRVVIAHRLSTVENCDRILVLEEGRLIEEGSYESLMEQKGRFYELAARQLA